jgi:hypothetical protein
MHAFRSATIAGAAPYSLVSAALPSAPFPPRDQYDATAPVAARSAVSYSAAPSFQHLSRHPYESLFRSCRLFVFRRGRELRVPPCGHRIVDHGVALGNASRQRSRASLERHAGWRHGGEHRTWRFALSREDLRPVPWCRCQGCAERAGFDDVYASARRRNVPRFRQAHHERRAERFDQRAVAPLRHAAARWQSEPTHR